MTSLTLLAISVLADDTPRNTGPDFGKASPVGLLVIVLLLIGTFLLVFSMNRHLKKLPNPSFAARWRWTRPATACAGTEGMWR